MVEAMPIFFNRIKARKFTTAADTALEISPSSSATPNFVIEAGGKLKWSSGSATADTTLYRSGSNTLKTDDSFDIASGHTYKIDGVDVVTATSLGSGITHSHLTSLGNLNSLTAATPTFSGPLNATGPSTLSSVSASEISSTSISTTNLSAATPSFTGPLTSSGSSLFSGRTDLSEIRETIYPSSVSGGVLSCDYNNGCVFYLPNGVPGIFIIDITNVPTDNNYATTISVIVNQGANAYYPSTSTISINGSSVSIKWANSAAPSSGNANKIDIWNFTLIRYNDTWTVLGSESKNYGA